MTDDVPDVPEGTDGGLGGPDEPFVCLDGGGACRCAASGPHCPCTGCGLAHAAGPLPAVDAVLPTGA